MLINPNDSGNYFCIPLKPSKSRDSSVGIVTGYRLDDQSSGIIFPAGAGPPRPDRLWGPPSLLSNGYRELFPRG